MLKKKSQYSVIKSTKKVREQYVEKSHSIVCRKKYKKVIVQYVEKSTKKSQYSMSEKNHSIVSRKGVQKSHSIVCQKKSQYSKSKKV